MNTSHDITRAALHAGALALCSGVLSGAAVAQVPEFPIAATAEREFTASVAFDGVNFLVGIQGSPADHSRVCAQLVAPDGALVGGLIDTGVTGGTPFLAYGLGTYLMAWEDDIAHPDTNVVAALVEPAGAIGPQFVISAAPEREEVVDVTFGAGRFLVTYYRTEPGDLHPSLYASIVSTGGATGPELLVTDRFFDFNRRCTASDGARFLVAWTDDLERGVVRARFVEADGTLSPPFVVNDSPNPSDHSIAAGFDGGAYLLVFSEEITGPFGGQYDLYGQRLDPDGALLGELIPIATGAGRQGFPLLATDGAGWLVTWTEMRNDVDQDEACGPGEGTCWDVVARYFDSLGQAVGAEWTIAGGVGDQFVAPACAGAGGYLVAWNEGTWADEGGDVYGTRLGATSLGRAGCLSTQSSMGWPALLSAQGSASLAANDLTLRAAPVPEQPVLFFYGPNADQLPFGNGYLCLSSPLFRLLPAGFGADHVATRVVDLPSAGITTPGTQHFQCWFRDPDASGALQNLSSSLSIPFVP